MAASADSLLNTALPLATLHPPPIPYTGKQGGKSDRFCKVHSGQLRETVHKILERVCTALTGDLITLSVTIYLFYERFNQRACPMDIVHAGYISVLHLQLVEVHTTAHMTRFNHPG